MVDPYPPDINAELSDFSTVTDESRRKNITILIDGLPGTGKTHLACTAPKKPAFLFDTEGKGDQVAYKFGAAVKYCPIDSFQRFYSNAKVLYSLAAQKKIVPATIIFDTLSDLIDLSFQNWTSAKVGIKPVWSEIYLAVTSRLEKLRDIGYDLILVARHRMEYTESGTPTGGTIPAIPDRIPYFVDAHLRVTRDTEKELGSIQIIKNGFVKNGIQVVKERDLSAILELMKSTTLSFTATSKVST